MKIAGVLTVLFVALTAAPAAADPPAGAAFPSRIDLPDGFNPEGITSGAGTAFYVGSLADGAIWRGDLRTGAGGILVEGADGNVAVGVDYQASHDRLWVAGGPTETVKAYDGSSGALLASYTFPGSGFLNDLTATSEAVYVTDSFAPHLAVVPFGPGGTLPDPGQTTTLPLTGEYEHVPDAFNANGIVAAEGGRTLILIQAATNQLFTVDPASGMSERIELSGDSLQPSGDGLELRGHTLYVVQNFSNRVSVARLGAGLATAEVVSVLTDPELDVPTTATLGAGRLWAVNARFSTPPEPDTSYWVTQLRAL